MSHCGGFLPARHGRVDVQEKAAPLALLLVLLLAGCVNPFGDKPDHWDVQLKLTVVTSARAPAGAEDVSLAVEQATRAFNASGVGVTYRLVQDNAPDGIAKAMDRLVKGKPAAFIAALAPDEAQVALDKAAAAKIPLLLVTPTNATLSGASTSHLLQTAVDPAFGGRALAALAQEEAASRIVLFADDDPYTARAVGAFKAAVGTALALEVRATPAGSGALAKQACDADADAVALFVAPTEAADIVRGLEEARCREGLPILAAPWVRQNELVETLGDRPDGKAAAEGIRGVSPAGTKPGVFRGGFEAVYGRGGSRLAAPAHDAVAYATLAAFAAKGGPGADPFIGAVQAADLRPHLLAVANAPGLKADDIVVAAGAVRSGDDIDWIGFEHDLAYAATGVPQPGPFDVWRVSAAGGFDTTGATVDI